MSDLVNYQYEGIRRGDRQIDDRQWSGECQARNEKDLRVRLDAQGIELKWCAPLPPREKLRMGPIVLGAVAIALLPLTIIGILPWYVPALFGGIAAVRGTESL